MKQLLIISLYLSVFTFNVNSTSLPYSQRMAQSQMTRSGAQTSWDYPTGLFVESVLKTYDLYGGDNYYNYALNFAKATVNTSGKIGLKYKFTDYTLDNINPGMFLMDIYKKDHSGQYKIALDTLRKQLDKQPRTPQGGFWHKNSYPNQMWLDGLYMASRFYASYEVNYNSGVQLDDVVKQFTLIHSKTYDAAYQLNYHAWSATPADANSFWAKQTDPFKGCSPEFWARGLGWYAAALVDVLEVVPANYAKRQELVDILNQVAAGIKRWQDPSTGCWYQLLRYDNTLVSNGTHNYLEASASSMFTYAILKAVRLGLISKTDYQSVGEKGYQGLITNFISEDSAGNVSINNICSSAGLGPASNPSRNGTIDYYLNGTDAGTIVLNDLKGVGPFILASIEYEMLQTSLTENVTVMQIKDDYRITNHDTTLTIKSSSGKLKDIVIYNMQGEELKHWMGHATSEVSMTNTKLEPGMLLLKINGYRTERILLF
ncbi:MAG: glycoside hydrolase family 88 protein [Paludibacter sp.]|nr:glycoside hydrolase family 88 protein [Paludibacter sp.]